MNRRIYSEMRLRRERLQQRIAVGVVMIIAAAAFILMGYGETKHLNDVERAEACEAAQSTYNARSGECVKPHKA